MQSHRSIILRRLVLALIAVGAVTSALLIADGAGAINNSAAGRAAQADLPETICGPGTAGQPALLKTLVAATTKTETAPFQPRADRAVLDAAYADAMQEVAARFPADDTVRALYAESGDGHPAVGLLGGRRRASRRAAAPRSSRASRRC